MTASGHHETPSPRVPTRRRSIIVAALGTILALAFLALGIWQIERLQWKLDLIASVDARIHAPPAAPPAADAFDPAADAYRHVTLRGHWLGDAQTFVQAVTELGPGFWVMTPLLREDGPPVLINRGFVPADRRDAAAPASPQAVTTVTGLLRPTEPGGGFLRSNDAAGDRWFSRDVAAIAAARGLGPVAPYFIDADATANPGGFPVGGLTVVTFRNSHLIYAITWFCLAGLVGGATLFVLRDDTRRRAACPPPALTI